MIIMMVIAITILVISIRILIMVIYIFVIVNNSLVPYNNITLKVQFVGQQKHVNGFVIEQQSVIR